MANKQRTRKGIYYFETYEAAYDYAKSVGVTLQGPFAWPKAVFYLTGWAIQLAPSGDYLGTKHVKLSDVKVL